MWARRFYSSGPLHSRHLCDLSSTLRFLSTALWFTTIHLLSFWQRLVSRHLRAARCTRSCSARLSTGINSGDKFPVDHDISIAHSICLGSLPRSSSPAFARPPPPDPCISLGSHSTHRAQRSRPSAEQHLIHQSSSSPEEGLFARHFLPSSVVTYIEVYIITLPARRPV